nr:DNA-directed DNA polymerase [Tanacetum cinerariifolium]
MKQNGFSDDALRLSLFQYSLMHNATAWYDRLPRNSIHTFDDMMRKFLSKYFTPLMVTKLRNEITKFRQDPNESLFEAWECYKLSIDQCRCPNHNMLLVTQIDTLYKGLTLRHQDTINAAAGGTFMQKTPEECYDLIEYITAHHNHWDTSVTRDETSRNISSTTTTESPESTLISSQTSDSKLAFVSLTMDVPNDAIKLMLFPYSLEDKARIWYEKEPSNSILTWDDLVNKFVNQFISPSKTTHLKNEISRFTQRFDETFSEAWDRFKELLRACLHHGFSELTQIDTFYNGLTEQDQDSLNAASGGNLLNKTTKEALQIIENKSKNNQGYRAQVNNVPNFQNQGFQNQPFSVPNNQIPPSVPNEFLSYIKSNEIAIKSMQNQINVLRGDFSKHEEKLRRNLNDDMRNILSSFFQNQPLTSGTLSSNTIPNPKGEMKAVTTRSGLAYEGPSIPTESPLEKVDEQNTEEILDKEHSNSSGSTAQVQPTVVPISIPEPDVPRTKTKPTISYPSSFADALILMPKFASTIKSLLANKDKLFELAKVPLNENCSAMLLKKLPEKLGDPDRSITRPKGVAEDVFVKVGKFHLPTDFVVVNFKADPRVPLILGRSFLRTGRALIDVYGEEITLRVPIVKSSSPTLTSFGERDILFLEKLLNEDPFQIPPMDLKLAEESKEKSSIEEPPELELKELPSSLLNVLKSHKWAIAWKISDIKGIDPRFCTHKILMKDDYKPAIQSQRRVNPKIYDVIKKEVIKLLDVGMIYPISDSPWVIPIHCVPKKGGNEFYCFLDDFSAYFQIPIDPQDQEKTTFTCPYGTFVYQRMPFGLCNAPGTFQRCMMSIFHDMIEKTMEVFMDHFSVFGDSFSSCLTNLDKMLNRCEETNLVLNWEKCHFMCREGIVLGHKISKSGIKVNRAKVDVIAKLPHPTTVKGVRSFLGHAGFYRRFIQDFSKIARPMTHLLEKETPFVFPKECIEAFNTLKKKLTEALILVVPDWNLPFELMCDTSNYAIGAVLGQRKSNHFQPIHYASKTMTEAQIHYTTTEKEMLAVVYAFEKFRPYLVLSKRIVYTDHSALKCLLNKQDAKPRLLRWVFLLQEFDITILDKKGFKNLAADHLSRLENPHQDVLENKDINENFLLETLGILTSHNTPWKLLKFSKLAMRNLPEAIMVSISQQRRGREKHLKEMRCLRTVSKFVRYSIFRTADDHRKLQLNKLSELRDQAYENSVIYKERTKKLHDSKIKNRIFNVGNQVLLFNSRLKIFYGKLKTCWSGPFTITRVFPYGTIELSQHNGLNLKVNGYRVKHYFGGDVPSNVASDLP